MPSVSKKQHNLMAAVANNPAFAKKAGIPQRVGADFLKADKGRKFAKGGDMAKKLPPFMGKESKAEEAKEMKIKRMSPALYKKGEKAEGVHGKSGEKKPTKYAKGGFTSCADGVATKGRTKAQKFADGGFAGMDMVSPNPYTDAKPMVGRAGPNRMMSPSMTPAGGAGLSQLIKDLGGGRQATPEEIAKMNSTLSSLGMSRPQFNPADADKLRAQMQSRLAAQGMRPIGMGLDQRAIAANPAGFSRMTPKSPVMTNTAVRTPPSTARYVTPMKPSIASTAERTPRSMTPYATTKPVGMAGPQGMTPKSPVMTNTAVRTPPSTDRYVTPKRPGQGVAQASSAPLQSQNADLMGKQMYMKKGGSVKTFAKGGSIDGCATKGKTKGRYI